ncbi:MAG: GlxA family transcriptional regulator [Pseudomonadota bacterium]|nr:GlxA family transcriptional regulator [Pseudomonadota bacterium]
MFAPSTEPLELEVLVLPDSTLMQTAAVLEPLRAANRIRARTLYRWTLTTPDGRPARTTSGIEIPAARAFDPAASAAPLLIVASYNKEIHFNRDLSRRVGAARRHRPAIGAVETGVWLMAEAGLLDGRRATAHWEDIDEFAARFPAIDVRDDPFVVDGSRFTSGAASPTLDMMLELIRRRQGPPLALEVSKAFVHDPGARRAPARPSLGRLIRSDKRVARAVGIMESHAAEPLTIDEIASRVGASARHLQSLFAAALDVRPKHYYLSLRLGAARRRILETSAQISEIASDAGFLSLAAFDRAYLKQFRESPTATRRSAKR